MTDTLESMFGNIADKVAYDAAVRDRGGYSVVDLIWGLDPPSPMVIATLQIAIGAAFGAALFFALRKASAGADGIHLRAAQWAAWGALLCAMAGSRGLSTLAAQEMVVRFLAITILGTVLAYVAGYFSTSIGQQRAEPDRKFFEAALRELEEGQQERGLWAQCLSVSKGDENSAKARYLKQRALELAAAK